MAESRIKDWKSFEKRVWLKVIKSIPDFVKVERVPENDFCNNRGNLIDYTEAYVTTAEKLFTVIIQEIVTLGERDSNEYILKAEEVEIVKNYFDDSFWDDEIDAIDGVNWYGIAKELNIDLDDNNCTVGFNNPIVFISEPKRKDFLFFRKLKDNTKCLMVNGEGDIDIVNTDDYDVYFP